MNHYDNDRMMNLRSNLLDYAFSLTSDHALAHQLVDESTARAFDGESVTEDDAELRGRVIRLMHAIYDRKYSRLAGCINDNVECYDADIYWSCNFCRAVLFADRIQRTEGGWKPEPPSSLLSLCLHIVSYEGSGMFLELYVSQRP